VGVALVTSGPGATNTVTPIRDAMADSVPMVVLTGQVPRPAIGTDAFQEAPVFNIMMACAKHVFLVENPEELEATLRTAFWIARTGRPGPVVIDIPKDVQNAPVRFKGAGLLPLRGYRRRVEALSQARLSDESARAFFQRLGEAHRPLLYVGGGVVNADASAELREFAETFQIPVVTTLLGIGALDKEHPLNLHMLGMHGTAYANYAVEDCDFLFAVGARFRRPRGRQGDGVRPQGDVHRPPGHRPLRNRQGQDANLVPCGRRQAGTAGFDRRGQKKRVQPGFRRLAAARGRDQEGAPARLQPRLR
jgi:acetolactate synthase-1/2/3 large subunit